MPSIREDLNHPLNEVQRSWIRRPAMLFLWLPLVFINIIVAIPVIVFEVSRYWFKSCWNVEDNANKGTKHNKYWEYCEVLARNSSNPRGILKDYICRKEGVKGHIVPESIEIDIDNYLSFLQNKKELVDKITSVIKPHQT